MDKNKISIAKISRPSISGIYPRTRLFTALDDCRKQPLIWVSGPGGSGKTALVASYLDARKLPCMWYKIDAGDADIGGFFYYMGLAAKQAAPRYKHSLPLLTPEYTHGVPVFTKRYFEELFKRLKPPSIIVLDNYQEMPEESGSHELLAEGLSSVPEKINIIIISRNEPSSAYIRLKANSRFAQIGWSEIRFTEEEAKELVQLKERRLLSDGIFPLLHKKTEGWAAGLVLMIESAKIRDMDYDIRDRLIPQDIFEYFAGEIFKKTDEESRLFLLKTAFLPEMTARIAEELTGVQKAGRILSRLHEKNYFIEMHYKDERVYVYHLLFREFLIAKAREIFGREEIAAILKRAALLLVQSGQVEAAAVILMDSGDWNGLTQLIQDRAQSFLSQGRIKTLDEWLDRIPSQLTESMPWLLYWKGVCRLPYNPPESRVFFERAFQLFKDGKDVPGTLLSWAGAVDTFSYEFDDFKPLDAWIDWLDERIRTGLSFPTPDIEATIASSMTMALLWRRLDHCDIKKWVDRTLLLAQKSGNINLRLKAYSNALLYFLYMGESADCELIVADMKKMVQQTQSSSPLVLITLKSIEASFYTTIWETDRAIQISQEGLKVARETGIHILDPVFFAQIVYSSLGKGDRTTTEEFLGKMKAAIPSGQRSFYSHYLSLVAWHNLAEGNTSHAAALAKKALALVEEAGTPFQEAWTRLLAAQAAYETGDYEYASDQLTLAKKNSLRIGSTFLEYRCYINEAYFAFGLDDVSAGTAALRKAMAIGRQKGYLNMLFIWRPKVMTRLCIKALEAGIEVEYAQNLVRKLNLEPDDTGQIVESWPWPVKVFTFGQFEIATDGKLIKFSGKVQQKPLAMLKALISFGGKGIKEEKLCDLLWPEAEGDAAHSAFSTTLQRLRALIGTEKAVQVREGRISLDPRSCWTDVWTFESLIDQAESEWKKIEPPVKDVRIKHEHREAILLIEKAIVLYKGHFLPADADQVWTLSCRERLRSKFLRSIVTLGNYYEETRRADKAVECYERALNVDDLSEEIYQHLMLCHKQLGRNAEVISVYKRCSAALSAALGISPSPKTMSIYGEIANVGLRE